MTTSRLGLTSRKQAATLLIVGIFLAPVLIGVPVIIWALLADWQLAAAEKEARAAMMKRTHQRMKAEDAAALRALGGNDKALDALNKLYH